MAKWILVFLATMVWALPARAENLEIPLEVNLVKPSNQSFLNIESCEAPGEVELEISWSIDSANLYWWTGTQEGDVFLAADDTCASSKVEIGKASSDGVDVDISQDQTSGQYPVDSEDILTLADIEGLACGSDTESDYYFCIKWEFTEDLGVYENVYTYRGGAPIRFDVNRPDPPTITSLSPGETNLKVAWTKPGDDDLDGYMIYYSQEGSEEVNEKTETSGDATSFTITGLTNGVTYEVWMTAIDEAENESEDSNTMTGVPEPVQDFYEYYRNNGGGETGGFCFVATAAYGSYHDAMVMPLRSLRDNVLMKSSLGRELVAGYYRYGPRWARAIRGSGLHRSVARWSLLPAVAAASASAALGPAEWLVLLAGLLIMLFLIVLFIRRRQASDHPRVDALLLPLGLLFFMGMPAEARAQDMPDDDEFMALDEEEIAASRPTLQFSARFGPYAPDIDSEDGLTDKPFKEIFGGSEYLIELGLDYEIWRGFGVVSAGGSVGFVQYLGKARTLSGSKSSDTTVLNLVPFRMNVNYTFDKVWDWWGIPFMPYVTAGISYYIWWVTDGVGDVAKFEDGDGNTHTARGGLFGGHVSVGLKLLLDVLDQEAATNLESSTGIMNSFFFAEYAMSWVDHFGASNHMSVGDQTVMFGLMMEF